MLPCLQHNMACGTPGAASDLIKSSFQTTMYTLHANRRFVNLSVARALFVGWEMGS